MSREYEGQKVCFESTMLNRYLPLQTIVCCPCSKKPLTLLSLESLLPRLSDKERKRIPAETVGAFVSESSLLAYPIMGRIVNFLEQNALKLSKIKDSCTSAADSKISQIKQDVK